MLLPARAAGLYEIRNMLTGHFYIGSSVNMRQRFAHHRAQLRHARHGNQRLQRAWTKYGEAAFTIRPIAILERDEITATEERMLVRVVGRPDCYNMRRHVNALIDWSQERRDAVSRWTKGRKYGPCTAERRAALSAAAKEIMQRPERRAQNAEHLRQFAGQNKGKRMSDEARANVRAAAATRAPGKRSPHSAETRAKIAAKALGRKMSEAQRAKCRERRMSDETRAKMRAAHLARHAALRLARAAQP